MGTYQVEILNRENIFDASGLSVKHDIADFGIDDVASVKVSQLYRIFGPLKEIEILCNELLADPITQRFISSRECLKHKKKEGKYTIEVWLKPGVTDSVGDSVLKACRDMGLKNIKSVKTGVKYMLEGNKALDDEKIGKICNRLLANAIIQTFTVFK